MNPNTSTTRIQPSLKLSAVSAALLLSASAFAADASSASTLAPDVQAAVTDAVYAGGEAMAPEVERRVTAMISGQAARADVRQELAEAQAAGTLAGGGELADSPELLQARVAFNDRQAQTLMARYEAEQQRLMAARQSQVQAAAVAAAALAPNPSAEPPAAAPFVAGPAQATDAAAAPLEQQPSTEQLIDEATAPADAPLPSNEHQRPAAADELPAAKPDEMPISGPVEADALSAPVDTE